MIEITIRGDRAEVEALVPDHLFMVTRQRSVTVLGRDFTFLSYAREGERVTLELIRFPEHDEGVLDRDNDLLEALTGLGLDAWVLHDGTLLARQPGEPDAAYRERLIVANQKSISS